MTKFKILDEAIDWSINRAIVVYVQDWTNNALVGCYKGCVVAVIPYQSEDGRQNALGVANQIVAVNPNCTMKYEEESFGGEVASNPGDHFKLEPLEPAPWD